MVSHFLEIREAFRVDHGVSAHIVIGALLIRKSLYPMPVIIQTNMAAKCSQRKPRQNVRIFMSLPKVWNHNTKTYNPKSQRLTCWGPRFFTIPSIIFIINSWSTLVPYKFQLLQPIGGRKARPSWSAKANNLWFTDWNDEKLSKSKAKQRTTLMTDKMAIRLPKPCWRNMKRATNCSHQLNARMDNEKQDLHFSSHVWCWSLIMMTNAWISLVTRCVVCLFASRQHALQLLATKPIDRNTNSPKCVWCPEYITFNICISSYFKTNMQVSFGFIL